MENGIGYTLEARRNRPRPNTFVTGRHLKSNVLKRPYLSGVTRSLHNDPFVKSFCGQGVETQAFGDHRNCSPTAEM